MAVITISRQSGSQGNEITRILCERLGYGYFDKKMIDDLAEKLGWHPERIIDLSEQTHHAKTFMEQMLSGFQTPFGTVAGSYTRDQYIAREFVNVSQVKHLILSAYEHGNVVIVGRGSQVVLAGKPGVLHVRVVAPLDKRIETWQSRQVLSYEEARRLVRERDKAHKDFVEVYFDADLNDCSLYDLVVNTNQLIPEDAADVIIAALEKIK